MTDSILPAEDEHLTNGWEQDTPADDTLIRRASSSTRPGRWPSPLPWGGRGVAPTAGQAH